jgi:site-specific DNA-methyltransferase (adenine-specific)
MEMVKEYPDNHFDLAIVDPPYGIGESGATNNTRGSAPGTNKWKGTRNTTGAGIPSTYFEPKEWDRRPPDENYFYELRRVSRHQIIFGANHFIDNIGVALSSPCWIVWDKINGDTDFADCELAWTSFKSAVRKFAFMWNGMLQGDMKNKEHRIHPTQKPVALYRWLLQNYAKEGDKILDTHLGSGSIAIACYYLGFDLTGSELDPDYYAAMMERIDKETRQQELF